MCIAEPKDTTNSSIEDIVLFKPYNESDQSIRVITGRGYRSHNRNLNFLEINYFGRFYTKYDYSFLRSIGFMQEYGYLYRSWRDDELEYHLYGIIGVEIEMFNNLYFDLYFGLYPVLWPPTPISGIRPRYTVPLHKYIKVDVGGSLDFTQNVKIYCLYIGFIFF